jgi:hypothetical protein
MGPSIEMFCIAGIRAEKFFIGIRRNPLKSFDSKKQTLVNASNFTSVYSHLLAFSCVYLLLLGVVPASGSSPHSGLYLGSGFL